MNKLDLIKSLYSKSKTATKKKPVKNSAVHEPKAEHLSHDDRQARLVGEVVRISFHKNAETVALIKRITQRKYIKGTDTQYWTAPVSLDAIDKLREGNFNFDRALMDWENDLFAPVTFDPHFKIPGIKHFDYFQPYQIEGPQIIEAKNGRVLLADDQGLGKTMQVLAWLQLRKDVRRVLVICPAVLKLNWQLEAEFWMESPNVQVIDGMKPVKIWGDIVVINYDILTVVGTYTDEDGKEKSGDIIRKDLWSIDWECIVLDEAHYICNAQSRRGWAVQQLCADAPHVIPITATPGKNRPKEIFTLAALVDDRIFPSFFKYAHRYCGAKQDYVGNWNFNGSSNEDELYNLLTSSIMLRRKKRDVFKTLDKKVRAVVPLQINNRKEYDKRAAEGDMSFQKIEQLSKLAVRGKLDAAIDWLWNLLDTEDKIVIFAEHKDIIDRLMKEFGDLAVKIDGSITDPKKRNAAIDAFQRCAKCGVRKERHAKSEDACATYVPDMKKRVFIGSSAAKEGVTLTASWHVVFLELWWVPKDHEQAEDRCYGRAGDLHGATAWYLIAYDTIEEYRANVLDIKNRTLERIMDGRELTRDQMLMALLAESKRRNQ
jgi:SWI/SNF-related matrix-associated actin-dependent regulator of chromatin subfamily A-like protein 1